MKMERVGFIGGGNMAEAVIRGMTSQGLKDILVSEPGDERRSYLEKTYFVKTTSDNRVVVSSCSIIILSVKPQNMPQVLDEIRSDITEGKTVVSIAAGIPLAYLKSKLNTTSIIRVMPNTPALIQSAMSVMSLSEDFKGGDADTVRKILESIGKVLELPEKYMDAVTALSGSGPAFLSYFIDAMIEGGVKAGLKRETSQTLMIQTLMGTAKLLDTGMSPSELRKMVASPGGTTEAGLKVLDENDLMNIVLKTVQRAVKRSQELVKYVN